jgi:hypothetical protein
VTALGARIWPWVPAGLLGAMLAGLGTMASIAIRDPGFALERDYYQKAVNYDRVIAQRSENTRLGWSVVTEVAPAASATDRLLIVRARDERGPISGARGSVEALRNATAATPLDVSLVERAPGEYEGRLPALRGGLWEFRLTLDRGTERFTTIARHDVTESTP